EYEKSWPEVLANQKALVEAEHDKVVELGGLYVLGTERHESRRIDNQLRGRSGRQGDPGESRFYLSLEDDLMRRFNSVLVERFLGAAGIPDDMPIESKMVSNAIKSAQTQVEAQNFEMRKNVLKYDDVMNRQREVIYGERREILEGLDISGEMRGFIEDTVVGYVDAATSEGFPEDWDLETLWTAFKALYPVTFTPEEVIDEVGGRGGLDRDFLIRKFLDDIDRAYTEREKTLTPTVMRELERKVMLSVLDRKWREHLYEMDYLQEGIGLRAMAQRDPLVEYQKEGYDLFVAMMDAVKEETIGYLFNVEVKSEGDDPASIESKGATAKLAPQQFR
ncbi:MAG: preprotein translocase subunit SecA, partial [Candidatus Nanopelagicaceae bacterium]